MATVREILDEARDYHPAFDVRRVPNKLLLRALARVEQRIAQKVALESPEALALEYTVAGLGLGEGLLAGITPPSHTLVLGVWAKVVKSGESVRVPVRLVSWADREGKGLADFPTATLAGGKLHLVNLTDYGGDKTGWEDVTQLHILYQPLPGVYADLDATVVLPDICHPALVANLALWLSNTTGVKLDGIVPNAQEAEGLAVAALLNQDTTGAWRVQAV